MSITSWSFAGFLGIILALYYTVLAGRRQWICLLLASVCFYCFSGYDKLLFLILTAATCWLGALRLEQLEQGFRTSRKMLKAAEKDTTRADINSKEQVKIQIKAEKIRMQTRKRMVLTAILIINFGILAIVKYWGVAFHGWLLPLGMSFYTFQSVGYLLDVYNGKVNAEKNFLHYFLFISFFPQLIQGPIARYEQLGRQLMGEHQASWEGGKRSLLVVALGLIKKYAIANTLSPCIAALLDDQIRTIPGVGIVLGILMYSFQQYADFSGGIDMVTGVAGLFGIELAVNFRQPYFAVSLGDFWRRWHISLGAWMRDYVFYPFALLKPVQRFGKVVSKRCGKHLGVVLPASIANILVFFLVGIWHGAQIHYILWGLYNGIVIAISDIGSPMFKKWSMRLHMQSDGLGIHLFRIARTFLIVNIGWYFDRIERFCDCLYAFKATFIPGLFRASELLKCIQEVLLDTDILNAKGVLLAGIGIMILLAVDLIHEHKLTVYDLLAVKPRWLRWGIFYAGMLLIQFAVDLSNASSTFLYANF